MKKNDKDMIRFKDAVDDLDKIIGKITDENYVSEIKKVSTPDELHFIFAEVANLFESYDDVVYGGLDSNNFIEDVAEIARMVAELEHKAFGYNVGVEHGIQ